MTELLELRRHILEYIKGETDPECLPVRFGPATQIGSYDPDRVLYQVRQMREEGYLEVMDVEMSPEGELIEVTVRGLTSKGEDLLAEQA